MLKTISKLVLIVLGAALVICIGGMGLLFYSIGEFDRDYSVTELKVSFNKKKREIYELKDYFKEIVPKNRFVEIEFDDNNTLSRFGIKVLDSTSGNPNGPMFLDWDLKINTSKMDSMIESIGWSRETLKILKKKLDNANCIGIASGEPAQIEYQRSGMGLYSFNVFDKPIPDSLKASYNDSCTYILASDRLVLEYGGGAVGVQCFYNLK